MVDTEERTPLQPQQELPPRDKLSPPPARPSTGSSSSSSAQKGCLLQFLTIFSSVVIVSVIGVAFMQVVSMYYMGEKMSLARAGIRIYVIFFCVIIILNELEWSALVRNSIISYSWIGRGLFYFFIGLVVLDQHVGHRLESQLFRLCFSVLGNTLAVSGVCYLLMGLMCLKRARDERYGGALCCLE
jgi:hypothetical protein